MMLPFDPAGVGILVLFLMYVAAAFYLIGLDDMEHRDG